MRAAGNDHGRNYPAMRRPRATINTRNVRPRLWSGVLDEEEEEDDWYDRNVAGRHFNEFGKEENDDEEDWFEKNLAGRHFDEFGEEERGAPAQTAPMM